ncbi:MULTISPECIES: right-handed parallel beta-helix repeat-containing protein [unclassified Dysgonomonas]|uniref:right-handed parallel beta-helix repeat-containing protein n=1 Tax=unclassified Dysgonomonas TaxID=2630389 RepID=UPI0025C45F68|nr:MULTISPECIES: right-handed parallel beta-helix repeat-containing protein [unclassified Dysgonomonas]
MEYRIVEPSKINIFSSFMKSIGVSVVLVLFLMLFNSCQEGNDFSDSEELTLSFSNDTIRFDTVFTTLGSATKQFKIYNRNNNSLTIQSIELVNASKSGFRMNIDGEKGTRLTNMDILKKDSLYGFVEVTVDPTNTKNPVLIRDSIRLVVNGNIQYVQLEAVGQDVYIWKDKVVTTDSVITGDKPLLIYNSFTINKGVTLDVQKGTTFFLRNNASVDIYGSIIAQGTVQEPIVFRGSRFDNIDGNIPYDNTPGQWSGIIFHAESYGNVLNNVIVKNAVRGVTFSAADTQYKKAEFTNTIVQNTSEYGLLATNCYINFQNCLFANSKGAAISLIGGKYSFLHCTLANYYRWSMRQKECLVVGNVYEGKAYGLDKCDFINSIVSGSASGELLLSGVSTVAYNYKFQNCLIKALEQKNEHFVNTVWNADPLFVNINNDKDYSYNFELQATSPAIGKADRSYSLLLPYDLKGRSRLADTDPDIGCYERGE